MKEITRIRFSHLNGLPNVPKSGEVHIILYDDRIAFEQASIVTGQNKEEMGKSYIYIDQLVSGGLVSNLEAEANEILQKAIVGGLLFGGAGAIVGAMIGREKKKTVVEHYFVLNYRSAVNGSIQSIYFDPFPDNMQKYKKFMMFVATVAPDFVNTDDLPDRFDPVHL